MTFILSWHSCNKSLHLATFLYISYGKDAYTNYPNSGRAATRDVPLKVTIDIDNVSIPRAFNSSSILLFWAHT